MADTATNGATHLGGSTLAQAPAAAGESTAVAKQGNSVPTAFALAWHLAEMYHGEIPEQPEMLALTDSLPGLSNLKSFQLFRMGLMQLRAGIRKLQVEDGE